MTMVHSAGNVETVMSELGCRNFIHSSELKPEPMNFDKYQFKHSAILLSASLQVLGSRTPIFVTDEDFESHKIQTLTIH